MNLVGGILIERCQNQLRATRSVMKEVKTKNSNVSAKEKDESNRHPPYR